MINFMHATHEHVDRIKGLSNNAAVHWFLLVSIYVGSLTCSATIATIENNEIKART